MKNLLIILFAVLLVGCSGMTDERAQESFSSNEISKEQPDVPVQSEIDFNEKAEIYFDYFITNSHVNFLLNNGAGSEPFLDMEMAAYALCELIKENPESYDSSVGFTREDMDITVQKYFGTTVEDYESRLTTVIPETGNITSTGWGGDSFAMVLKSLEKAENDIYTAEFYRFPLGMEAGIEEAKQELFAGNYGEYPDPALVSLVFEERTDNKGEMYLYYYEGNEYGEVHALYNPDN